MKFYLPVGGLTDHRFGILTNYNHKSIPQGIINYFIETGGSFGSVQIYTEAEINRMVEK